MLAEGEGFEPSLPMLWAKRFSRPPHSAALPPFQKLAFRIERPTKLVKENALASASLTRTHAAITRS